MPWFFTVLFLISTLTFTTPSEASHEKKHSSVVVVGTVYCDTCFQAVFVHTSHFISGASVGVECKDGTSKPSFQTEVKTDSHGVFKIHLPFSVSKHVKKIEGCSVKLISSSEPYCAVASTATSSSLHLKSRKQGTHIFSAGFFTYKPLKQPSLCNQKPSIQNSNGFSSQKASFSPTDEVEFPPPLQDPTMPDLSPLPRLPDLSPILPQLPPLPSLPGLPGIPVLPPFPGKTTVGYNSKTSKEGQLADKKVAYPDTFCFPIPQIPGLPPNPLRPPSIFPPNPCLPQPPPLIPNPVQPPPAPLNPNVPPVPCSTPRAGPPLIPNLPPVPGLTPPPPFPFLPPFPFPFPPVPRIPGIPPASSSKQCTSP